MEAMVLHVLIVSMVHAAERSVNVDLVAMLVAHFVTFVCDACSFRLAIRLQIFAIVRRLHGWINTDIVHQVMIDMVGLWAVLITRVIVHRRIVSGLWLMIASHGFGAIIVSHIDGLN